MLKKLTAISALLLLTGCQNLTSHQIAYKLSDEDAKKWVVEGNKIEQCLFAKEYQTRNFNNLSDEERQLLWKGVVNELSLIIGGQNAQLIDNDLASARYARSQFQKFNHSEQAMFESQWCDALKRDYSQALKQLRAEIKKRKAEETAREKNLERQRKAEADFYASKEGQAYLAQQQLMLQQQNLQNQVELQQQAQRMAYERQLAAERAQRMAYERQLAAERAERQGEEFQDFVTSMQNSINGVTNSMAQTTQMINAMTQSMPRYQYQPQQSSSTTCYRITSGIVRCNHQ